MAGQVSSANTYRSLINILNDMDASHPLAAIQASTNPLDDDSLVAAYKKKLQIMPQNMRRCSRTVESYARSLHADRWIDVWDNEFLRSRMDPFLLDEASSVVNRLMLEIPYFFDFEDVHVTVLKDAVGLALQYGVPEEEMIDLAADLSYQHTEPDTLLYGFLTVVSLWVASALDRENRANGGIGDDIDPFVYSVESAVRNGSIGIDLMTVGGHTRSISFIASYNEDLNVLFYPPVNERTMGTAMFDYMVHEPYHALQDIERYNASIVDIERPAYEIGYKAAIRLSGGYGPASENHFMALQEEMKKQALNGMEADERWFGCMGYPDEIAWMKREAWQGQYDLFTSWFDAVYLKTLGFDVPDADHLFTEAYERLTFNRVNGKLENGALIKAGRLYEAGRLRGFRLRPEEIYSLLDNSYAAISIFGLGSRQRSDAAEGFLREYNDILSLAYYLDRDLMAELGAYLDEQKSDAVAESLVSVMNVSDGV